MSAVLATRIGRWLVDFWKIFGPLFCMICGVLFWHAGLVFSCAWPSNDLRQVTF